MKKEKRLILGGIFLGLFLNVFVGNAFASIPLRDMGAEITPSQVLKTVENYNLVPEALRKNFEENGNIIYFHDHSDILEELLGMYTGNDGKNSNIMLTNQDFGGAEAITHEMGHFFDDILQPDNASQGLRTYSQGEAFMTIFKSEAGQAPVSEYEKLSAPEYFAGAFGKYCTEPEVLKEKAPLTYQTIEYLIHELCSWMP